MTPVNLTLAWACLAIGMCWIAWLEGRASAVGKWGLALPQYAIGTHGFVIIVASSKP